MKYFFIYIVLIFTGQIMFSQDTLTVKLHPAKQYPWTVLYQLKNVRQEYIDNKQQNKDSVFIYKMQNLDSGMYLLMYDMDSQNFVYFIYNHEPVTLEVFPKEHNKILIRRSKENKVFLPYAGKHNQWVAKLNELEKQLDNDELTVQDRKTFTKQKYLLTQLQTNYLNKSKSLLAHKYIAAMTEYYPDINLPKNVYWKDKKAHYLSHLDFNDEDLQRSNILINKINTYVFEINPPKEPKTKHLEYMKRIETVLSKIKDQTYRNNVILSLTNSFINVDGRVTKMLIEKYVRKMPEKDKSHVNIQNILEQVGITIGEKAPDFNFTDFLNKKHTFSKIIPIKPYTLLIFWSATCSHCLHAMPIVKKLMKNRKDFNVVAIGIEYEKYPWSAEQQNYPDFYHGLKLQKWQNPLVKAYGVHATPTFFILNNQGEVIAKPYEVEDLESWLKNHPAK